MSLSISSSFASALNYGDVGSLYQSGGFDPAGEVEAGRDRGAERATAANSAGAATGTAALAQAESAGGESILASGIDPSAAPETTPAFLPPPPQASGRGQLVDLSA